MKNGLDELQVVLDVGQILQLVEVIFQVAYRACAAGEPLGDLRFALEQLDEFFASKFVYKAHHAQNLADVCLRLEVLLQEGALNRLRDSVPPSFWGIFRQSLIDEVGLHGRLNLR